VRRCLHHPTFSHFSRTLTCDRQIDTDRQKHSHGIYRAEHSSRCKNEKDLRKKWNCSVFDNIFQYCLYIALNTAVMKSMLWLCQSTTVLTTAFSVSFSLLSFPDFVQVFHGHTTHLGFTKPVFYRPCTLVIPTFARTVSEHWKDNYESLTHHWILWCIIATLIILLVWLTAWSWSMAWRYCNCRWQCL